MKKILEFSDIEIKSSVPTIEDWKYKEQKLVMMPPKIQQLEN